QWHVHQVFTEKPDLQFIGAKDIADHHVIGTLITDPGCPLGQGTAVADDDLMCVQQTGDLDGNLFASFERALDASSLSDIVRHRQAHAAQKLNAFGYGVHDFDLFVVML